ncbi:unnamed protein product [Camellia sinensis]
MFRLYTNSYANITRRNYNMKLAREVKYKFNNGLVHMKHILNFIARINFAQPTIEAILETFTTLMFEGFDQTSMDFWLFPSLLWNETMAEA